jgi:predicted peptidase
LTRQQREEFEMNAIEPVPTQSVVIANSEARPFWSATMNCEYLIKIRLPENYSESENLYPVLYLLDGDHMFAMATDIVQYLIYGEHIPDLIIVSPSYGSKNAPRHGGTNQRESDLAPFPLSWTPATPRGAQYLDSLENELIPFVESKYRIDSSNRTLWGYSLGGIFVLYALFEKPNLFKQYGVVDGFNDNLGAMEQAYANANTDLPAKLFLSWGDELNSVPELLPVLKSRNYAGLELTSAVLNGDGHFTVPAEGLTKGLIALFRNAT